MAKRGKRLDIYAKYRRILKMPNLSNKKIDEMRKNLNSIDLCSMDEKTKSEICGTAIGTGSTGPY
jgi:hypothetical protein